MILIDINKRIFMKLKTNLVYHIMLFAAALIWGSSFVVVKSAVGAIPPNLMIFIRFSISCVIISLIFIKQFSDFRLTTLWRGMICGVFLFLGYMLQTIGIINTTPGKNAFLTAIYVVIVPFLFWAIGKMKPDIFNISSAVLCLVGIGFIALDGGFAAVNIGDILTIISGFAFAAHIVVVAIFAKDENPILITILQFGTVALCAGLMSLFTEKLPSSEIIDLRLILDLGYLVVFATALALLMQTVGQAYVNPSTASLIISLEAVFGVLTSVIFGYEKLNARMIIGFALVFAAVVLSETKLKFLYKGRENRYNSDIKSGVKTEK